MKKGLLTVLLASLVLVGCQNYDDQFDDLNAQISALKTQVDGLSSLSAQVSSLSGTISGLSAGVSAAQSAAAAAEAAGNAAQSAATAAGTEAAAATAAANAIDFSSLTAGLATLQAEVDAIQASLATAATATDIATLQAELDGIEADVTELLEGSGVYTTTLQITNSALLSAAKALGNGINVISGGLNVAVTSDMNMGDLQTVIDKVYNVTGNVTFTNTTSANQTPITFNKLTSSTDVNLQQKGAYELKTLVSARTVTLGNTYSDDVSKVHLDALTSVTSIVTGSSANAITFDQATAIDLGSLAYYTGGDLSLTTKNGGTLDIASLTDTNSAGTLAPFKLTIAGPETVSLSLLDGDGTATTAGEIEVSKVDNLTITGFSGTIDVNNKVENLTIEDGYLMDISGATDLETATVEGVKAYGKTYAAKSATNQLPYSYDSYYPDFSPVAGTDDLSSVTLTGQFNVVNLGLGLANLATVTMNAKATSLSLDATPDLTSAALAGSTINDVSVVGSGASTLSLDYGYRAVAESGTASDVTTGTLTVTDNLDLTSLTSTVDDIGDLDITGNTALTTLSFANLNSVGTTTAPDADVYNNALTAVKATDTYQATIASTAVHGSTDTGSYDAGTSGMDGLQSYLDAIVTNGTTVNPVVMFDVVTTEVAEGATAAATTSGTTTPGDYDDSYDYTAADFATTADTANDMWMVLYLRPSTEENFAQEDVIGNEVRTYVWDVDRVNNTLADDALTAAEGVKITFAASQTLTFDAGDTYTGSANGSTVATVDDLVGYLDADTTLDAVGINLDASRSGYEETVVTVNYLVASGTASAATSSGTSGFLTATFGDSHPSGTTEVISMSFGAAVNQTDIANKLMAKIHALANYDAVTTTSANSNQFVITRNVSGTSNQDISPIAVDAPSVTFVLDAAQTSTSIVLAPAAFDGLFDTVSNAGSYSRLNGSTTSSNTPVFSLYTTAVQKTGLALRLINTGTVAFSSAVTAMLTPVSNGALLSAYTVSNVSINGHNNLLIAGTNIEAAGTVTSSSATSTTKTTFWVAGFSDVSTGNVTTQGDAAITCDRTQWLS
tara:strand:+ start:913 stop:4128 length:3216 start_codon:yes stop_codon:yes gene_type:complete